MKQTVHNGFLLIELMVGLLVFIFFMHISFHYAAFIMNTYQNSMKRYEVCNILSTYINELKKDPSLLRHTTTKKDGCTLVCKLSKFPLKSNDLLIKAKQKVQCLTITAQWKDLQNKTQKMAMVTGIAS